MVRFFACFSPKVTGSSKSPGKHEEGGVTKKSVTQGINGRAEPDPAVHHKAAPAGPERTTNVAKAPKIDPSSCCGVEARLAPYQGAPFPMNEEARLQHLYGLGILDTSADSRFDDITRLLCTIFKVPIAIVSLVEAERQWFKSIMGLPVPETDRSSSFCAWTLLPAHPEVLVVEDATKDARFKHNPLVKSDPHIRFYAGAPLVSSTGLRLGSLCVIDRKQRQFDAEACNLLCNFAEIVVRQIESSAASFTAQAAVSQQARNLLRALNCFSEGLMLVQMTRQGWRVLYVNEAWSQITGVAQSEAVNKDLWEIFSPTDGIGSGGIGSGGGGLGGVGLSSCASAVRMQTDFQLTATTAASAAARPGDRKSHLVLNFRPAHLDPLDDNMQLIGIPGNVPWQHNSTADEPYYFATIRRAEDVVGGGDLQPFCEVEGADAFPEVVLGPLLGKGSFGKVYRGIWKGVPVAVKVIQTTTNAGPATSGGGFAGTSITSPTAGTSATSSDKPGAALEAIVSMSIAHPNVVQTFKTASRRCAGAPIAPRPELNGVSGSGTTPGGLWRTKESETEAVAMTEVWILAEFCDLGTLVDGVEKGWFRERAAESGCDVGPSCLASVVSTAREIASALQYLHSMDIVHGDLTGNNVMLVSSARDPRGFIAKVTDFGLSRIVSDGTIKTETFGTATHMPPELLTRGICSKAVDVYGYGVLVWEMWNGRRAWGGMHQLQVIFNVTVQNRKLEFGPEAPRELVDLAARCMETDAERRPSFEHVLAALDKIQV